MVFVHMSKSGMDHFRRCFIRAFLIKEISVATLAMPMFQTALFAGRFRSLKVFQVVPEGSKQHLFGRSRLRAGLVKEIGVAARAVPVFSVSCRGTRHGDSVHMRELVPKGREEHFLLRNGLRTSLVKVVDVATRAIPILKVSAGSTGALNGFFMRELMTKSGEYHILF